MGVMSAKYGLTNSYGTFPDPRGPSPGLVTLSDWSLLPAVLSGGGARFVCASGTIASLTITNYEMHLDWFVGGQTNWLRAGDITLQNSGRIRHVRNTATTTNAGIFIDCSNLTIENGGQILASAVGFPGGAGTNEGSGLGHGGYSANLGGGGGYGGGGGAAGAAHGGTTYGSITEPIVPGSGGGGGAGTLHNTVYGGAGGGYIRIMAAGNVSVAGNGIVANGGNGIAAGGNDRGGGGSGGGIYIRCGGLRGDGSIQANGGTGSSGAGGGGGRIAIYAINAPFYTGGTALKNAVASGSSGASAGTNGTVFLNIKPRGTVWATW
jgi:hypothetical protein